MGELNIYKQCECCGAPMSAKVEQFIYSYWCSYCGNGESQIKKSVLPEVYIPRNRRRIRRLRRKPLSAMTLAFMGFVIVTFSFTMYYYYLLNKKNSEAQKAL